MPFARPWNLWEPSWKMLSTAPSGTLPGGGAMRRGCGGCRRPSERPPRVNLSWYEAELQGVGNTVLLVDFSIKPYSTPKAKFDRSSLSPHITKQTYRRGSPGERGPVPENIEDGPLGMAIVGRDYRFAMVNRMFCEMLGYTAEELLTLTFTDTTAP